MPFEIETAFISALSLRVAAFKVLSISVPVHLPHTHLPTRCQFQIACHLPVAKTLSGGELICFGPSLTGYETATRGFVSLIFDAPSPATCTRAADAVRAGRAPETAPALGSPSREPFCCARRGDSSVIDRRSSSALPAIVPMSVIPTTGSRGTQTDSRHMDLKVPAPHRLRDASTSDNSKSSCTSGNAIAHPNGNIFFSYRASANHKSAKFSVSFEHYSESAWRAAFHSAA